MKKIIITTCLLLGFMTTNLMAKDCSMFATFSHKFNMCKLGLVADGAKNMTSGSGSSSSSESTTTAEKKPKKGFFKKLKSIGESDSIADIFKSE